MATSDQDRVTEMGLTLLPKITKKISEATVFKIGDINQQRTVITK